MGWSSEASSLLGSGGVLNGWWRPSDNDGKRARLGMRTFCMMQSLLVTPTVQDVWETNTGVQGNQVDNKGKMWVCPFSFPPRTPVSLWVSVCLTPQGALSLPLWLAGCTWQCWQWNISAGYKVGLPENSCKGSWLSMLAFPLAFPPAGCLEYGTVIGAVAAILWVTKMETHRETYPCTW